MQVKWKNSQEKKVLLEIVKNLLVAQEGELKIRPSKQQVWIDYPPPSNFKLYWCDEETEFLKNPSFSEKEKEILDLLKLDSRKKRDRDKEIDILWNLIKRKHMIIKKKET